MNILFAFEYIPVAFACACLPEASACQLVLHVTLTRHAVCSKPHVPSATRPTSFSQLLGTANPPDPKRKQSSTMLINILHCYLPQLDSFYSALSRLLVLYIPVLRFATAVPLRGNALASASYTPSLCLPCVQLLASCVPCVQLLASCVPYPEGVWHASRTTEGVWHASRTTEGVWHASRTTEGFAASCQRHATGLPLRGTSFLPVVRDAYPKGKHHATGKKLHHARTPSG